MRLPPRMTSRSMLFLLPVLPCEINARHLALHHPSADDSSVGSGQECPGYSASFNLDWICCATNPDSALDIDDRIEKSVSRNGHAVLADRVFDGHGWHAEAAVLIRDGRIVGLGSPERAFPPSGRRRASRPARSSPRASSICRSTAAAAFSSTISRRPTACAPSPGRTAAIGTTACLPTLITDTREQMRSAIAAARSVGGPGRGSRPASRRALHQSAASGGPPARPDRAACHG